jgi:N-acetylmuramoyl-L-alanine amidase
MPHHTVQPGECLVRIAARHGYRDYRTVYEHPLNAELRQKRPDPNLLFPGDVVVIPDKTPRIEQATTDQAHRYRLSTQRRMLRLVLLNLDGKPMAEQAYTLDIEGRLIEGITDGDGLLEQPIPLDAVNGQLSTDRYVWPLNIAHLNPIEDTQDNGVTGIQARLRNLGYDPGPIDGIAGPLTEEAVRAFQEDNPPLAVDGICGPQTRAMLVKLYGC